jgi:hypothetical protein
MKEQLQRLSNAVREKLQKTSCQHRLLDKDCTVCRLVYELRRAEEVLDEEGK